MSDPLERILRLVADGSLSAEEAAPILEALQRAPGSGPTAGAPRPSEPGTNAPPAPADDAGAPRWARIEVREHGRRVVDLRVPISLGRFALARVPGLSREQVAEVEQAVTSGVRGPILDVEDTDGDGVRILLE